MITLKKHIIKLLFVLVVMILGVVIYYEYHNPNIYHAKYLDKYHKDEQVFIIKNNLLDITNCRSIERWSIKNLPPSSANTIVFITHSDDIEESYAFLKEDYSNVIWSNLVCMMNKENKKCYFCPENINYH